MLAYWFFSTTVVFVVKSFSTITVIWGKESGTDTNLAWLVLTQLTSGCMYTYSLCSCSNEIVFVCTPD